MGLGGLNYFRRKMETAAHNISNADKEGYSRQRVESGTMPPYTDPALNRPAMPGQIGTGVKIEAIKRIRDEFLDQQYKQTVTERGKWEALKDTLERIELLINEPGGTGLKDLLDEYWQALEELHKRPESLPIRQTLVQKAQNLTEFIRDLSQKYTEYREFLNREIQLRVDEANNIIDRIAQLNDKIVKVLAIGDNPNDLLDERDLLLEKLSELIDCKTTIKCGFDEKTKQLKEFKVYLDNKLIIQGTRTRHLVLIKNGGNDGFYDVQLEDNTYDISTDPDVATAIINQNALEQTHVVNVHRIANELRYEVGNSNNSQQLNIQDVDQALGLNGKLLIQVGNGPTRKKGETLTGGIVLNGATATAGDSYKFLIRAGQNKAIITVTRRGAPHNDWDIQINGTHISYSAGNDLTLTDIANAINSSSLSGWLQANVVNNQLEIRNTENHLLSIYDLTTGPDGNLTEIMGIKTDFNEDGKVVEITVTENDSLTTIRNKINAAFRKDESSPQQPENWLHASIEYDKVNNRWYLKLTSNTVGEDHRIHILPQSCNLVASRLGLIDNNGITFEQKTSIDGWVTIDGKNYLTSTNTFREARRIQSQDNYTAETTEIVTSGIRYTIRGVGETSIQIHRFIKSGKIRGLLESRDDTILTFQELLDELAYTLTEYTNAISYSGHGIGEHSQTTGTNFFTEIKTLFGASKEIRLNKSFEEAPSLIPAASDDGNGYSRGDGDGSIAIKLAQLKQEKILSHKTADFNEFHENVLALLGIQSQEATYMYDNNNRLATEINTKRQEVMGVNIDEEMTNIVMSQQAFNAIARYMTAVDEMLDRIINGMGLVGR